MIFLGNSTNGYGGCIDSVFFDGLSLPLEGGNAHFTIISVTTPDDAGAGSSLIPGCTIDFCQNNGTRGPSDDVCTCPSGFTGSRCETDIDACISNPCPAAAIRCEDLPTGHRCIFAPPSIEDDSVVDDLVNIYLLIALAVVILIVLLIVSVRRYTAYKVRKYRLNAEEAIDGDGAVIYARDTVHDLDGRGNVMDYHGEGGGEGDLDSVHIAYDELLHEKYGPNGAAAGSLSPVMAEQLHPAMPGYELQPALEVGGEDTISQLSEHDKETDLYLSLCDRLVELRPDLLQQLIPDELHEYDLEGDELDVRPLGLQVPVMEHDDDDSEESEESDAELDLTEQRATALKLGHKPPRGQPAFEAMPGKGQLSTLHDFLMNGSQEDVHMKRNLNPDNGDQGPVYL